MTPVDGRPTLRGTSPRTKRPSASSLREILERAGRDLKPDDPALASWCENYFDAHKRRLLEDMELCRQFVDVDEPLLEIGSIPPHLTAGLKMAGFRVVGVDIAPERFSRSIRDFELEIHKCDIEVEPLPFRDATFRHVLVNEVFEHLRINPIWTMTELCRVMKPNGFLWLSTPNLHSARGITNFVLRQRAYVVAQSPYREFAKLRELGHMGHVREYTPLEVDEFMRACGFRPERVMFRGWGATRLERALYKVLPRLRPFFTMVLQKPVPHEGVGPT